MPFGVENSPLALLDLAPNLLDLVRRLSDLDPQCLRRTEQFGLRLGSREFSGGKFFPASLAVDDFVRQIRDHFAKPVSHKPVPPPKVEKGQVSASDRATVRSVQGAGTQVAVTAAGAGTAALWVGGGQRVRLLLGRRVLGLAWEYVIAPPGGFRGLAPYWSTESG